MSPIIGGGGGGGGGGPAAGTYTQVATVDLTNAQILALHTTAVTVAAAIPGKLLLPTYAILWANFTADYTNIDVNCTIEIDLGQGNADWNLPQIADTDAATFLQSSGTNIITFAPQQFTSGLGGNARAYLASENDWIANGVGQPITLSAYNHGSGNFTGGNAANKLRVTVQYLTISQP